MFDTITLIVAITLTFQVIGLGKYKAFLILAVGGYIALIPSFTDYVAIIIAFVGVMLFNLWYLYDSFVNQ